MTRLKQMQHNAMPFIVYRLLFSAFVHSDVPTNFALAYSGISRSEFVNNAGLFRQSSLITLYYLWLSEY